MNANVYVSPLSIFDSFDIDNVHRFKLKGAVAAPNIRFAAKDNSFIEVTPIPDCGSIDPPTGKTLEVSPLRAINLSCAIDPQTITFQVKNSQGQPDENATELTVSFTGSDTYVTEPSPLGDNSYITDENGLLVIKLSDPTVGIVNMKALITGADESTAQSGSYQFVPNKFEFDEGVKPIIANQETAIQIQAYHCNADNEPEKITGELYSGDKTLRLSTTNYEAPEDDVKAKEVIEIKDTSGSWVSSPSNAVKLNFSENANASTDVLYPEAGSVSYTLTDEICITNDDDLLECEEIIGTQQLDARPWTFAICHDTKSLDGSSSSGLAEVDALAQAGELFTLKLHPLRYIDINSSLDEIHVADYCNEDQTQNFFGSDAPKGTVTLESTSIDSPKDGQIGDGLQGTTTLSNENQTSLIMDDLFWKDVGSLNVTVRGNYLGEITPGTRSIGRFYPSYLTSEDSIVHPPEHSNFAYMNQQLRQQFKVFAHAVDGSKVQNYHLFDKDFASVIGYVAQTNSGEGLEDRLFNDAIPITLKYSVDDWRLADEEPPYSQLVVDFDDFEYARVPVGASSTYPDGPYTEENTEFGLDVNTVFDDVTWTNPKELNDDIQNFFTFTSDYDFRYGRMVLSDVAGDSGQSLMDRKLIIPLKVEYWNGEKFEINDSDGESHLLGSKYSGVYHCVQQVWIDNGVSAANFSGVGGVIDGEGSEQDSPESSLLYGTHTSTNTREQIRMWVRMGSQTPKKVNIVDDPEITCPVDNYTSRPWLRYNWRNLGDEDPSAIITFGTFRGNDRIIYRGEPGLTGN